MEINPVHRLPLINPPSIDKYFYVKYLQNIKYSREPNKVNEGEKTKVVTAPKPSDVEKKVEKGYPFGYYGNFLVVHPFYYYREEFPDYKVHATKEIYRTQRISDSPKNLLERYKRNVDAHNRAANNEPISGKGKNIDKKV